MNEIFLFIETTLNEGTFGDIENVFPHTSNSTFGGSKFLNSQKK